MAIRFKNGGDGTTAEGAILVANPDEFRDALNYQIPPDGSIKNWKFIELEADLDLNYSVDWYYRMKDIFNINALMDQNGQADRRIIINGMGHSITNIYVYPNCAVFGTNSDRIQSYSTVPCILEINDVTFEAIIQKGGGFFSGSARQEWPGSAGYRLQVVPRTNGCIFNIKFDNSYNYSTSYMYLFDYSSYQYTSSTGYILPRAVNCIFNIYISAQAVNHRPLFKTSSQSDSDFSMMTVFESCEFRIRNNTDKLICIFDMQYNSKFLIDNCAIFFADVKQYDDPTKRTSKFSVAEGYAPSSDARHLIGRYSTYLGYIKALFYNSYIAAFGDDFNSGYGDPIYFWLDCTDTNQIVPATSFYDKNKIFIGYSSDYATAETSGFSALTTAQCKDKTTLSNIGYLFAEEV